MQRCTLGECCAACCLYGVWLDREEADELIQYAEMISPHLKPSYRDPSMWLDTLIEEDPHTPTGQVVHARVVEDPDHYGGTACIFLRDDHKCGLQVAGEQNGFHPWRFKPFYCILHPLDLGEKGEITLDRTEALLQEPASCLRPASQPVPLLETFAPELEYLLGKERFSALLENHS